MIIDELKKIEEVVSDNDSNELLQLKSVKSADIKVYPKSINKTSELILFIGWLNDEKNLFVVTKSNSSLDQFEGTLIDESRGGLYIKKCILNHSNALKIQHKFQFTNAKVIGIKNSFGFGDRLGLANPAHIRSLQYSDFKPILAQQSIRELTRTKRTPQEVMDAAVWAVLQEGYKEGFGADADHLKTNEDIDLMISAGFRMFTFDPGEFVINEADTLNIDKLKIAANELNWKGLENKIDSLLRRYDGVEFNLSEGFVIKPTYEIVLRAIVKYGNAIAHIKKLYDHLTNNYSDYEYEVEISVDETESVTSPFEHFFMASELNRLGVKLISLAPRFIGDFEKGIDYIGDIEIFKQEYLKHVKIAEHFGSYKISLHSGSDKFGVYKAIGQLKRGYTHVKTAGTSYLEALKVVAYAEPGEFRKILDFSRIEYEKEKESYHVSANLENVSPSESYTDSELLELFNQNDARQVLHVTFGKVLTTIGADGKPFFKDTIINCLNKNEEIHYNYLVEHFKNHLQPFN